MTSKYDYVFSLGYRCSSAGILKSLGIKSESYPFDWMVTRLPLIEHCVQTDFRYFLNPNYYFCRKGVTNHYASVDPASRQWICDESVCLNQYYEQMDMPHTKLYIPTPITPLHDAYGYKCMMNHRNIMKCQEDAEYFARCVERWKRMTQSVGKRLSLYIHPAVFYEEFASIRTELMNEIRRVHRTLSADFVYDAIYILPVKTPYENPTEHCAKYVLEEQPDDKHTPGCRICILWTNRNFIDAGEIFMGNCHVETYVVKDYLIQTMEKGNLL